MRRAPEVMPEMVEELHRVAWQRLLAFIAGGHGDTGVAYRRMHSKIEAFFRWKGVEGSKQLADKTLDRIARRLAVGPIDTPAHELVLEVARSIVREERVEKEPARDRSLAEDRARESALEACLLVLGDQDRALFAQFHAHAETRSKLAAELGMPLVALRLKASKIRARIERCMSARIEQQQEAGDSG